MVGVVGSDCAKSYSSPEHGRPRPVPPPTPPSSQPVVLLGSDRANSSYTTFPQSSVDALVSVEVVQIKSYIIYEGRTLAQFSLGSQMKKKITHRLLIIYKCLKMSNLLYLCKNK